MGMHFCTCFCDNGKDRLMLRMKLIDSGKETMDSIPEGHCDLQNDSGQ